MIKFILTTMFGISNVSVVLQLLLVINYNFFTYINDNMVMYIVLTSVLLHSGVNFVEIALVFLVGYSASIVLRLLMGPLPFYTRQRSNFLETPSQYKGVLLLQALAHAWQQLNYSLYTNSYHSQLGSRTTYSHLSP